MFTAKDLNELLEYQAPAPVLSLIFRNDFIGNTPETNKLILRSLIKGIQAEEDLKAVRVFFEKEFDWAASRSAVVYSCQQDGFFRAYSFSVDMKNQVQISRGLMLKSLVSTLDRFSGFGVTLVDQQKTRMMAFHLGELVAESIFEGEEVQRVKQSGGTRPMGSLSGVEGDPDRIKTIIDRNFRKASQLADQFLKKHDIRRVFLGGTEPTTATFKEYLPKVWQSLISGVFPVELTAKKQYILELIQEIAQMEDDRHQQRLVETVITETAKGRRGVLRAEDVLGAVREGRIQTLLVEEDFHQPGFCCTGCDYLTVQKMEGCPFCSGLFEKIGDIGELAVRNVLLTGGRIKVIKNDPVFHKHGGIGALLRY